MNRVGISVSDKNPYVFENQQSVSIQHDSLSITRMVNRSASSKNFRSEKKLRTGKLDSNLLYGFTPEKIMDQDKLRYNNMSRTGP